MFGSKTIQKSTNLQGNPPTQFPEEAASCIVANGTVIEGNFSTVEDLRVDGRIVGDVSSTKRIVMGPTGQIEGSVACAVGSFIKGRIEGELKVNGTLHLHDTAYVTGKIIAKKLVVEEGASYNGECLIGEQHFQ